MIDAPNPQPTDPTSSAVAATPRRSAGEEWLIDPVLKAALAAQAAFVDARFVRRQGLAPSIGNRVLKYPAIAYERAARFLRSERQDLLFERFVPLHDEHYGPGGRGYQAIPQGSPQERQARYRGQLSRLEYFADMFPDFLDYVDGDVFADLGCGSGQNIQWLARAFPSSPLVGSDFNAEAVELVREQEQPGRLRLTVGDLRDEAFLDSVLGTGVDHIVLSHVFSLLFADSYAATRSLRQGLVDRFVEAGRKSVVIVDNFGARGQLTIAIEQKQRAIATDDVLSYFERHTDGRAVLAQSSTSQAVMFSRKS